MKSFWEMHGKKVLITVCAVCAVCFIAVIAVNTQKLKSAFNPDAYTDHNENKNNSIDYDSSVFGSDQSKEEDGLEMDQQAKDDYKLDDGQNQNILDRQKNQQGLTVADGNSDGTGRGDGSSTGIVNDGTGTVINGNGGSTTGNGNGSGNGTGNGSGGTGEGGNGEGGNGETGETTKPDPDADKYGTNYNAPEVIVSDYPNQEADDKNGVTVVSLTVTGGDLLQHFYEGEAPRSAEMENYITVEARMSDGSIRKNLKYQPNETTGGDYTVQWESDAFHSSNGYPKVGEETGQYTATLSYRGASIELPYDIVTWQVTLTDFQEDFSQDTEGVDGYPSEEYHVSISPENSPVIDLETPLADMYCRIGVRTELNNQKGTKYQYVNQVFSNPNDPMDMAQYCLEYFGGWAEKEDTASVGDRYRMKRPKDSQIIDGVYCVNLYPTWKKYSQNDEFTIALNGGIGWNWSTELIAYSGTSDTLVIPEGVGVVHLSSMSDYAQGKQNTRIKKIVFPESVYDYTFGGIDWVTNFFPNLESFEVARDNQNYLDIDGVLYNKTGEMLLCVPPAKTSIAKWSKTVKIISSSSFQNVHMKEVTLPATVNSCVSYGLLNAEIGTLTFEYAGDIEIGEGAFGSELTDQAGNAKLGVKKIVFQSGVVCWPAYFQKAPSLFLNLEKEDIAKLGLEIVVPDSEDNSIYLSALEKFQQCIDAYSGDLNAAYKVLQTKKHAEKEYTFQDGFLMTGDGKTLLTASKYMKGSVDVPDGVQKITANAFAGCSQIQAIGLSESVTDVETNAFANMDGLNMLYCKGKTPAVFAQHIFGDGLPPSGIKIYVLDTAYQDYLAVDAENLDLSYGKDTAVAIFETLPTMSEMVADNGNIYYEKGSGAYQVYKVREDLTGLFVPMEGTVEFMDGCFSECTQMEAFMIPDTLEKMGTNLFSVENALRMIISNRSTAPEVDGKTFEGIDYQNIELVLPKKDGVTDQYKNNGWSDFTDVQTLYAGYVSDCFANGNAAVYGEMDSGNYDLVKGFIHSAEAFALNAKTTEISAYAFAGCEALTAISNPDYVVLHKIGEHAFENCTSLRGVTLGYNCYHYDEFFNPYPLEIGAGAFKNCPSLVSLEDMGEYYSGSTAIPLGIEEIPDACFENDTSLEVLQISDAVTSLGKASFKGCSGLREIDSKYPGSWGYDGYVLPYGVSEIPNECFAGCTSLKTLEFPASIQSVQSEAFADSGLEIISFQKGTQPTESTYASDCFLRCAGIHDFGINNIFDFELFTVILENANARLDCLTIGTEFNEPTLSTEEISMFSGVTEIDFCGVAGTFTGSLKDWENLETFVGTGAQNYGGMAAIDTLDDELFAGCQALTTVDLGDVKRVGNRCFAECPMLSTLHLYSQNGEEIALANDWIEGCSPDMIVLINGTEYGAEEEIQPEPAELPAGGVENNSSETAAENLNTHESQSTGDRAEQD
ncbi:MAG: leucine-rich repeat protein [Hespellia sp.]|nr:leucine-rich repeat protein [Hespellia sp.]